MLETPPALLGRSLTFSQSSADSMVNSLLALCAGAASWDRMQGDPRFRIYGHEGSEVTCIFVEFELPASVDQVAEYIMDTARRPEWEQLVESCRVVPRGAVSGSPP